MNDEDDNPYRSVQVHRTERLRAQEAARRARVVSTDSSGRVTLTGSWLYGRLMSVEEVQAEFIRREGRPMGSPILKRRA